MRGKSPKFLDSDTCFKKLNSLVIPKFRSYKVFFLFSPFLEKDIDKISVLFSKNTNKGSENFESNIQQKRE